WVGVSTSAPKTCAPWPTTWRRRTRCSGQRGSCGITCRHRASS
ncbi:MAG: hypothetical protein, partial [Olavius algarvensis Gamma 3 endosymbiont]